MERQRGTKRDKRSCGYLCGGEEDCLLVQSLEQSPRYNPTFGTNALKLPRCQWIGNVSKTYQLMGDSRIIFYRLQELYETSRGSPDRNARMFWEVLRSPYFRI